MESVIIVASHAYTLEKLRHRVSQNYDILDAAPDQAEAHTDTGAVSLKVHPIKNAPRSAFIPLRGA